MSGDKIADNLAPGIDDFRFVQTFLQAEPLHQLRKQLGSRLPAVRTRFFFGKTTPFGNDGGSKGGVHNARRKTDHRAPQFRFLSFRAAPKNLSMARKFTARDVSNFARHDTIVRSTISTSAAYCWEEYSIQCDISQRFGV